MHRATTFYMHIYSLFAAFTVASSACAITKQNTTIKSMKCWSLKKKDTWSAELQYLSHDPHKADMQNRPACHMICFNTVQNKQDDI